MIPTPGIYRDVPMAEYATWEAVNFSRYLKPFALRSPRHAKHEIDNPPQATSAMAFGRYVHALLLEPDTVADEFAVAPKVDRRAKAGKEAWAQFEQEAGGRTVLTEIEAQDAQAMAQNVRDHPTASAILSAKGANEVSLAWEERGVICKARVDRAAHWGKCHAIVDVKTCQDASPDAFARDVAKFAYHIQAAHYLAGARRLSNGRDINRVFVWVAVEKSEPFGVGVYVLTDEDARHAERRRGDLMEQIAECMASGVWPGYCHRHAEELMLPPWAA